MKLSEIFKKAAAGGRTSLTRAADDKERVKRGEALLGKYRAGKVNLDRRIVENEQWYKMRRTAVGGGSVPSSGWLFNAIANKHAEAMDNYPSPVILPREESDRAEAEALSAIVPVILDRCDFEQVFSDEQMYKLKTGTGVYGVFWDTSAAGGYGDVAVRKIDLLNLFWEPGVSDIQESANLFHVESVDNERLTALYPVLEGKLGGDPLAAGKYVYDDAVDASGKSLLVDWYYKKRAGDRTVVHLLKFCRGVCLFSSEDDPVMRDRGFYDHAKYPFVFDTLYTVEGSPAGFGFIDVGKGAQDFIDRGGRAVFENLLAGAKPRYFERIDGSINEEEFCDFTKSVVHVSGNLGEDSVRPVDHYPLSGIYLEVLRDKINELKETVGNRDVSTGGTVSGVTAASAIAAMQEAGAKLTRDNVKAAYRAFRLVVLMIIELIRQFYDVERRFRIIGPDGAMKFIGYENSGIVPRDQGVEFGEALGVRTPLFDVKVSAQKSSPYSKMAQNELALELYKYGIFAPERAPAALLCLEMMDLDGKEAIMEKIAKNAGMGADAPADAAITDLPSRPASFRGGESAVTAAARERAANVARVD
ncbi:MAG: hypothetical protein IJM71_03745 [Clostridia bacterium]|nr:hypothetical protein [Clostridia bacterium]